MQAKKVKELFLKQPVNTIFYAAQLYNEIATSVSEQNYYKILERMKKDKSVINIGKGLYYVPSKTKYGYKVLSEAEIIEQIVGNNSYYEIGYGLYNKKKLTTQIPKQRIFFVSNIKGNQLKIKNIIFYKKTLNYEDIRIKKNFEMLEILQNFQEIQDINYAYFHEFLKKYLEKFDEEALDCLLAQETYKKSTLAFLKEILNKNNIQNNIDKHLSSLSKYKIPQEAINYAIAR